MDLEPASATHLTAPNRAIARSPGYRLRPGRRATFGLFAAGLALVAGGGVVDLALHVLTDLLGVADPALTQAEPTGHVVILAGMAITIGGIIGEALRRATTCRHQRPKDLWQATKAGGPRRPGQPAETGSDQ